MTYRDEMAKKTKNKIINTSVKLFKKYGYDNVTVKDIIGTAKVSNGAFYAHFKNKEALLEETIFYYDQVYLDHFQKDMCTGEYADKNPLQKLELFVLQVNRILTMNGPESVRIYMGYTMKHPAVLARDNRHYYRILRELIAECRQQKLINDLYTNEQLLDMLFYLNRSIPLEWAIRDGDYPIAAKDDLITIFIQQIKA